jgi:uncharacterized membrane protein YphA (DoxX/SURF4 family)
MISGKISLDLRYSGFMWLIRLSLITLCRFFTSSVFLAGAVKNILHWHETEKNIMSVLSEWQSHCGFSQEMQIFFSWLISWSSLLLLCASLLCLVGGLLVLLGFRERLGVSLLVVFLIPVTVLYHPFWWAEGSLYELQAIMFLKNIAILGCLIQILVRDIALRSDEIEGMSSARF